MKAILTKYIHLSSKRRVGMRDTRRATHLRRTWYMILGCASVVLLVLFAVAVHLFFLVGKDASIATVTDDVYHPPLSRDVVQSMSNMLHERAQRFQELRASTPSVPHPDTSTATSTSEVLMASTTTDITTDI